MTTVERPAEQELALTGVLEEFRTALQEEIYAARRSAAAAGIQFLTAAGLARRQVRRSTHSGSSRL
jgi:hypothetical protein